MNQITKEKYDELKALYMHARDTRDAYMKGIHSPIERFEASQLQEWYDAEQAFTTALYKLALDGNGCLNRESEPEMPCLYPREVGDGHAEECMRPHGHDGAHGNWQALL